MKKQLLRFLPLLVLTSCSCPLKVQTDYLTYKDLASYYVNTPDPRQNMTTVGQRLIVSWVVPKYYLDYDDLHLEVTVRFRTKEEVTEIFPISKTRGTYVFALLNADYFEKKGFLTYKVNLMGNGCVLEEWRHRIWTDLISFSSENTSPTCPAQDPQDQQEEEKEEEEDEYPIDWDDKEKQDIEIEKQDRQDR